MDFVDIFPATIAVTNLKSLTPEVIKKAIDMIDLGSQEVVTATDGTYTREQNLLDKVLFRDVKDEILACCLEFASTLSHQVEKLHICNSWGNVVGLGQSIHLHRHVNSYISGSFYLTEGSAFTFHNFNAENLFPIMPKVANDDNYRSKKALVINPKPGRLILFPSGLYHSVLNSEQSAKRYSVAFNIIPLGRIGTPTNLVNLASP